MWGNIVMRNCSKGFNFLIRQVQDMRVGTSVFSSFKQDSSYKVLQVKYNNIN